MDISQYYLARREHDRNLAVAHCETESLKLTCHLLLEWYEEWRGLMTDPHAVEPAISEMKPWLFNWQWNNARYFAYWDVLKCLELKLRGEAVGPPPAEPEPEPPVEPPPIVAPPDSDIDVTNAGLADFNGFYNFLLSAEPQWKHSDSTHFIVRSVDYPSPGVTSWIMYKQIWRQYVADDAPTPWETVWRVGPDGVSPPPTVTPIIV